MGNLRTRMTNLDVYTRIMPPASEGRLKPRIGILAGTGFARLVDPESTEPQHVHTPFGHVEILLGMWAGHAVALGERHGPGHRDLPHEVNSRAQIYALKALGARRLVALSAVGSLREELAPGQVVRCGQIVDRTVGRARTFFGEGLVAHVSLAEPTCPQVAAPHEYGRIRNLNCVLQFSGERAEVRQSRQYVREGALSDLKQRRDERPRPLAGSRFNAGDLAGPR